jgi:opacity protein-like surface antigen
MMKRLLLLLLLIAVSSTIHAQRFNQKPMYDGLRDVEWEASLLVQFQDGTGEEYENGAALDIDDEWGWGFGIGYNFTPKWNVGYRFSLVKPGYSATIVPEDPDEPPQTIDYTMSKYTHQFNATYHFLSGPLTPFVQAGAGWTKLDSNIISRPPTTGCWWDPWWGWICSTTWETFETTEFSYNLGLGFRWDVNELFFTRGSLNREWVKAGRGTLTFDSLSLEAGIMW